MILTPGMSSLTAPIYKWWKKRAKSEPLQTINLPEAELKDHVIIAGGGRVGQYVAQVLQRLNLAFILIEMDYRRVEQAKAEGYPVIYGDASQEVVLEAAKVNQACLVLITTPAIVVTRMIADEVRHHNPTVHIVARAEGVEQMRALHKHGVYEVVQPEFEAGLEITRQALLHLSVPMTDIQHFTDRIRHELYAPLYETHDTYKTVAQLQSASRLLELCWVKLVPESPLVNKTIQDSRIRTETGASVVGVMRDDHVEPNPSPAYQFQVDDLVAVIGNPEQLTKFQDFAACPLLTEQAS
jgi:CPA2 family monovalent cation:H+ antiporter-2